MPQRSNAFQRLVYLVKTHAAHPAVVTESKLLSDRHTGALREVDIVVETVVAGHNLLLAFECRDSARAADVSWVEEMIGKHERLPSNALVLASRAGFSAEARRVALAEHVELLSLDEGEENVRSLLADTNRLWFKMFDLSPKKVVAVTQAVATFASERVVLSADTHIFVEPDTLLTSAIGLVTHILRDERAVRDIAREGTAEHKGFKLVWEPPALADGSRLMLQKIEPRMFVPITCLEIQGDCNIRVCDFGLRHARLGSTEIVWGESKFDSRDAMLVASLDSAGKPRISVRVTAELGSELAG